jgi:hypothetical protein
MKRLIILTMNEKENIGEALKRKHICIPIEEEETGGIELNLHKGNLSKKYAKKIVSLSK